MGKVVRKSDVAEVAGMASAARKLVSAGFIFGLTATIPLKILVQSINVPVRGRFPSPPSPALVIPK